MSDKADIEPRQQSYVIGPPIEAGGTVIGQLMEGANVSEQADDGLTGVDAVLMRILDALLPEPPSS